MSNAEHGKIIQRKWQERMEDEHMIECPNCLYNYDRYHHDECPACVCADRPWDEELIGYPPEVE